MKLTPRPYHSFADVYAIGRLVRRMVGRSFTLTGWSFARHDISMQRRIADTVAFNQTGWTQEIHLWESSDGELAGAALFPDTRPANQGLAVLLADPDRPGLYPELLDWAQKRCLQKGLPPEKLSVEATEANTPLVELLESQGFRRSNDWMNLRLKRLDPAPEPVNLPDGYTLKAVETHAELLGYFTAVHQVFNFMDSEQAYRSLEQAPSFNRDLVLIVLDPAGAVAAFAKLWHERSHNLAEFEPVGTRPDQQQRGLGLAVMAEGCNRLRRLGCYTATVQSWSESAGANRLYDKAGYTVCSRHFEFIQA